MQHVHHSALESASVVVFLLVVALVYIRGWLRVRSPGPSTVERWSAASFLGALLLVWVALGSSMARYVHESLTAHMVQHLLLMTLAAPLIWLGNPIMPILCGFPRTFQRTLVRTLSGSKALKRLGRAMVHPAVCWLAAAGTLVGWHIPSLFALGMRSQAWQAVQTTTFLLSGLLFWWPVVRPWPAARERTAWTILLYLFIATLPCDILSGFLVFCDRVVYSVYSAAPRTFGMSVLEDQQCAGALMWTCVTVAYLIAGTVLTARLLSPTGHREYWTHQSEHEISGNQILRGVETL
jgi:putative membrane protein